RELRATAGVLLEVGQDQGDVVILGLPEDYVGLKSPLSAAGHRRLEHGGQLLEAIDVNEYLPRLCETLIIRFIPQNPALEPAAPFRHLGEGVFAPRQFLSRDRLACLPEWHQAVDDDP